MLKSSRWWKDHAGLKVEGTLKGSKFVFFSFGQLATFENCNNSSANI